MKIRIIRNQKVVTDSDLAEAINVPTKQLLNMFRRNIAAFEAGCWFNLTEEEQRDLIVNYCTTHGERLRYARRMPYVFSLPAILMLLCMQSKNNEKAKHYRAKFWAALSNLPADSFEADKIFTK